MSVLAETKPKSGADWRSFAKTLQFRNQAFINGQFQNAASGKRFTCKSPATGETLAEVAACEQEDVNRAVQAARRAFAKGQWARAAPAERKKIILRLADLIEAHLEEFALLDTLDMGKPIHNTLNADLPSAIRIFRWYAETADKLYDQIAPTGPGTLALVRRDPVGVVGAVVPWNYPLDMATWKCAPALITGNSVVLKPAEQSPLSALLLAELASEAGLPDGVLNVVTGFGETAGQALGAHNDVDCLAFTGSTEVGKLFLQYAGQSNMKMVWLECGGKSPNIVFNDRHDLDSAAEASAAGIFGNQGEVCSAASRLIVQRDVKDELVEKIARHARHAQPGDPLNPETRMGAIVSKEQTDRIMSYVDAGKRSARLVIGGERVTLGNSDCFVTPTIFDQVKPDDPIAQEEIFGPVLSVIPFDTEEEAVQIANGTIYGLAASVWTDSLSRAHRLADRLVAGAVSVNSVDATNELTPFGGFKQSGFGRDLSLHALDKYTALKTVWIEY